MNRVSLKNIAGSVIGGLAVIGFIYAIVYAGFLEEITASEYNHVKDVLSTTESELIKEYSADGKIVDWELAKIRASFYKKKFEATKQKVIGNAK